MDWENYRKSLGLSFDNNQRYLKCENIIFNELDAYFYYLNYEVNPGPEFTEIIDDWDYKKFCNEMGIRKRNCNYNEQYNLIIEELKSRQHDFKEFIVCFITFANSLSKKSEVEKIQVIKFLEKAFNDSGIRFEVLKNKENDDYFIFPNGAKELDDALIIQTAQWLQDYKATHKLYLQTLSQYSNKENPRDVADNLRKTLEQFLQEFFNNKKILANNIAEVGKYFDSKNVHNELKNIFTSLLAGYDNANNGIAKHHDNADEKMLEFLLYQTGVFIRTIITLSQS